jgi:hypothetical protein
MTRQCNATTSGTYTQKNTPTDWEDLLSTVAHLQKILPDTMLVGGTASAIRAKHRISVDTDHVLTGLHEHFDTILGQLESVAGCKTARIKKPILILGSLNGIETGIRQLIRQEPLETTTISLPTGSLTIPTQAEILRIKGILILKRNATRDYLDFAALAHHLGETGSLKALQQFDTLYPQPNGESALQQLQSQTATPLPWDLETTNLKNYKQLHPYWQNWKNVESVLQNLAISLLDFLPTPTTQEPKLGI